jgi:hypothetical protein
MDAAITPMHSARMIRVVISHSRIGVIPHPGVGVISRVSVAIRRPVIGRIVAVAVRIPTVIVAGISG